MSLRQCSCAKPAAPADGAIGSAAVEAEINAQKERLNTLEEELRHDQAIQALQSQVTPLRQEAGDGTSREQGVDVQFYTWRGLAVPKGVPANVKAKISDAYKKAFDSPEFQEFAAKASLNLAYQNAADFTKFLDQNYKDVEAVMKSLGLAKK